MNLILKNKIEDCLSNFNSGLQLMDMPVEVRNALEKYSRIFYSPRKTVLFNEGESPKGVYIIVNGKVKVSKLNKDGSPHNFYIFSAGDLFGHNPILSEEKNAVTATVIEDCEIMFIEKDYFLSVLSNSPHLSKLLIQNMSHDYTVFVNKLNFFAKRRIKERLALFLLLLNEKFKSQGQISDEAEIKVSRIDLANFTGTSIENLVRMLKQFKEKKYIRTEGKSIFIDDFEALYLLSGV